MASTTTSDLISMVPAAEVGKRGGTEPSGAAVGQANNPEPHAAIKSVGPAADAAIALAIDARSAPQRKARNWPVWMIGLAGSIAIHGAIFAWILYQPPLAAIGAGGQDLEAVSVEVVTAAALESLSSRASAATAGSVGPVSEALGIDAPSQPESVAASATEPERRDEPERAPPLPAPDVVAKPDPVPEPDTPLTVSELKQIPPDKPIEIEPEQEDREPPMKPEEQVIEAPRSPAAVASSEAQPAIARGGAMARALDENVSSDGSAGASPGELAHFALAVRQALGRSRPPHGGSRGKVVVWFRLTPLGAIEAASIARSSGRHGLDDAALSAVRAATFPMPPSGSTDAHRTYSVPFEFK